MSQQQTSGYSLKTVAVGAQMIFVAFGALVLVPLLTGLDPAIALFTAGLGTLVFQGITKGMVPVFLASSFAFIAPIQESMKSFGPAATFGGLAAAGIVYLILSIAFKIGGVKIIDKYLPAVVTGPVIMVIGLQLAPVAIQQAQNFSFGQPFALDAIFVAMVSLFSAIAAAVYGKRFLSLVPVLIGATTGYLLCLVMGKVNFQPVIDAPWFAIPWVSAMEAGRYAVPTFEMAAILFMIPVAIAPAVEHVGDVLAISSVTGKNFVKEPGIHRTILGDGVATSLASVLGGPPNTTYSEVTGAVALTKAFDPRYMRVAAIVAILLAFCGKLNTLLMTIPGPVMGGIMILLFGMIASIGISSLSAGKVDLHNSRNLVITAVILVVGIGGMKVTIGSFMMSGIGLAGIVGILLNLILPKGHDVL